MKQKIGISSRGKSYVFEIGTSIRDDTRLSFSCVVAVRWAREDCWRCVSAGYEDAR